MCTKLSYRTAADTINRFLHRAGTDAVKVKTLSDSVQRIGKELSERLASAAGKNLEACGFSSDAGLPLEDAALHENIIKPASPERTGQESEDIQRTMDRINASRAKSEKYSCFPPLLRQNDCCIELGR